MGLEWFSKLKEYDSLLKAKSGELKAMEEQNGRLRQLTGRREDSLAQISQLKDQYVLLQQELFELEKKMATSSEQKGRIINQGADEARIDVLERDLKEMEDKAFSLLEEIEKNESERKDIQIFLSGLERTIQDISSEVAMENSRHELEIKNLDLRLSSLLEELPSEFRDLLQKIQKKNLAHGPFTRTENGSCFFCRYKISRIDESEIDMQKKLRSCPQCSRIFIPYGT